MGRGALLYDGDPRRQERITRRELQRKFVPGTLCVTSTNKVFTVVGWSPVAATPEEPPSKKHPYGQEARAATWEVLVIVDDVLKTWPWTNFRSHKTLEEYENQDAVS